MRWFGGKMEERENVVFWKKWECEMDVNVQLRKTEFFFMWKSSCAE